MGDFLKTLIIALVSSGTVGSIVMAVIRKFFTENPTNVAMKLLIQDKLTYMCKKAIENPEGKISYSDWKMISHLYDSYKSLGGNGDMEHLMKQMESIPVFIDDTSK